MSTKKIRENSQNQNGSFLQAGMLSTSSTSSPQGPPSAELQGNHDTIPAMLSDIKASNQALSERMTKIERQSLESPSHTNQWAQSQGQAMSSSRVLQNTSVETHVHHNTGSIKGLQDLHPTADNNTTCPSNEHPGSSPHPKVNMRAGLSDLPNDSVLPNLETIRRLPSVSVSNILASYDSQNKQESNQGKPHRGSGKMVKKHLLYDVLSMPQWVAGQLTNILHMQDHVMALVQVITAMKDAVPFTAIKNPWACPMHGLEEGNLAWGDSTQWALNRLSVSQVLMIGSHSALLSQKKFCKYFNEGSCTHESHHGLCKHNCRFCGRQGRTAKPS